MDKDFYYYLYSEKRISKMITSFCTPLIKTADPIKRQKIRKLLEYLSIIKDHRFLIGDFLTEGYMITLLRQITDNLRSQFKMLDFDLSARIKDLFSTLNKLDFVENIATEKVKNDFLEKYIRENHIPITKSTSQFIKGKILELIENDSEVSDDFSNFRKSYKFRQNPFDRIKDFVAFRIVIEDEGKGDKIPEIYEIANSIIELVSNNSIFSVVPAAPVIETGELLNHSSLIFIPKVCGLKKEYTQFVKDYVKNPKKDGYQALHIVFQDPFTKQYIELQLCTRSMRLIAESDANHAMHKMRRYGKQQEEIAKEIDFSKIHLANLHFRYYRSIDPITGEERDCIHDTAGLTEPFVFNLQTIGELDKFVSTW